MVWQRILSVGYAIKAAPFFDAVVAIGGKQSGLGVFLSLGLDDVGHIDQLAVPGVQRNELGRGVLVKVRNNTAGHRGHDLLTQGRKRHDAVVDFVAAGFLVIGNHLLERCILFGHKALDPPHFGRRSRCIRDVRPRQGSGSGDPERVAKHRTPSQTLHASFPSPITPHIGTGVL
jgi:hypothetical protein